MKSWNIVFNKSDSRTLVTSWKQTIHRFVFKLDLISWQTMEVSDKTSQRRLLQTMYNTSLLRIIISDYFSPACVELSHFWVQLKSLSCNLIRWVRIPADSHASHSIPKLAIKLESRCSSNLDKKESNHKLIVLRNKSVKVCGVHQIQKYFECELCFKSYWS